MDLLFKIVDTFNSYVWGLPMVLVIFGLGIYLTFNLGFIQKYLFKAIKMSISGGKGKGEVSAFAALAINIAANVGTGSILGMTTAVVEGGPGAVFWMVFASIFGFATKYGECLLGIKYRVQKDGEYVGGPMYVMQNVLKNRPLAVMFSISALFMALTGGNALQSNSIADVLRSSYNINPWLVGIVLAAITGAVIFGGVHRVAKFSEATTPLKGGVYILAALVIIGIHIKGVPAACILIIKSAFTGKAAAGGVLGAGIMGMFNAMMGAARAGVSRSVFATEAALGSASIGTAAAITDSPVRQAFISATAVFWTTVICIMTGLVIILAGDINNPALYGGNLAHQAFDTLPYAGTPMLIFSLSLFAFTTTVGWYYYGEKVIQFLESAKWVLPFRIIWLLALFGGAALGSKFSLHLFIPSSEVAASAAGKSVPFMWGLAVLVTTFMTLPNIWSIWLMRKEIKKDTAEFVAKEFGKN
ncbi:MAG: amino acid carrier protein [Elusimicrobium sp.]|jgi:AGCS family alanine or glycine:cation symporter|nr:amino acid carrier protein [Elusimicrobium sp.]